MANPLHQFEIVPKVDFTLGSVDLSVTNSAISMLLAIVCTMLLLGTAVNRKSLVPGRWQSVAELLYEFVASMVRDNVGSEGRKYFAFVFTIFMVVLMGNVLGLIPVLFTYTSHIIVTAALALLVFFMVTILGIVRHGLHFFSLFVPPGVHWSLYPLLIPIELISYLSRPVSLSIRLFANMMAGHTMLKVFAGFSVSMGLVLGLGPLAIIIALIGLEVLVAVLQAYVFAILTCIYLRDAIELH